MSLFKLCFYGSDTAKEEKLVGEKKRKSVVFSPDQPVSRPTAEVTAPLETRLQLLADILDVVHSIVTGDLTEDPFASSSAPHSPCPAPAGNNTPTDVAYLANLSQQHPLCKLFSLDPEALPAVLAAIKHGQDFRKVLKVPTNLQRWQQPQPSIDSCISAPYDDVGMVGDINPLLDSVLQEIAFKYNQAVAAEQGQKAIAGNGPYAAAAEDEEAAEETDEWNFSSRKQFIQKAVTLPRRSLSMTDWNGLVSHEMANSTRTSRISLSEATANMHKMVQRKSFNGPATAALAASKLGNYASMPLPNSSHLPFNQNKSSHNIHATIQAAAAAMTAAPSGGSSPAAGGSPLAAAAAAAGPAAAAAKPPISRPASSRKQLSQQQQQHTSIIEDVVLDMDEVARQSSLAVMLDVLIPEEITKSESTVREEEKNSSQAGEAWQYILPSSQSSRRRLSLQHTHTPDVPQEQANAANAPNASQHASYTVLPARCSSIKIPKPGDAAQPESASGGAHPAAAAAASIAPAAAAISAASSAAYSSLAGTSSEAGLTVPAPQSNASTYAELYAARRHAKMRLVRKTTVDRLMALLGRVRQSAELQRQGSMLRTATAMLRTSIEEEPSLSHTPLSHPYTDSPRRRSMQSVDLQYSWHEIRVVWRKGLVVITQVPIKEQTSYAMAELLRQEHRLLEALFPRHVIEHITSNRHRQLVQQSGNPTLAPTIPYTLATSHRLVTVMFSDIVGFTSTCKSVSPTKVLSFLNSLYSKLDDLVDIYGVYKVETIGDSYMVVGGLTRRDKEGYRQVINSEDEEDALHAVRVLTFAKAMLLEAGTVTMPDSNEPVKLRVGIHSGSVTSGIVGSKMPRFCLFGDTVNTASRMESTCPPGCLQVSEDTYKLLQDHLWQATGGIEVKGKGTMTTYIWDWNMEMDARRVSAGGTAYTSAPFARGSLPLPPGTSDSHLPVKP